MYEIIKDLNETTKLAIQGERIYTLKKCIRRKFSFTRK